MANPFNPGPPPANAPANFNPVVNAPANVLNTQVIAMSPNYFNIVNAGGRLRIDLMKAITVQPLTPGSEQLEDVAEPDSRNGSVLVEAIAVGVCGTDVEIVDGKYGSAPPGKSRLVLGHESLGCVLDPGPNSALKKGDLVVGIVRRPDPVPCPNCAVGEWDMCRNGPYTERGIKQIDGFMPEFWRIEPEYTVKVPSSLGILGVLLEPASVVAKAWEQVNRDWPAFLLGASYSPGQHRCRRRRGNEPATDC